MSDLGDLFTAMRVEGRRRRESNRNTSPAILEKHGVAFEVKDNGAHLVVWHGDLVADFWPGTGKYKLRSAPTYKRGVFPLLRDLGVEVQP